MRNIISLTLLSLLVIFTTGIAEETSEEITWCEAPETTSEEEGIYCPEGPNKDTCCLNHSDIVYSQCLGDTSYESLCYYAASILCSDESWYKASVYCAGIGFDPNDPEHQFGYEYCMQKKTMEYYGNCMTEGTFYQLCVWDYLNDLAYFCEVMKYNAYNSCMEN